MSIRLAPGPDGAGQLHDSIVFVASQMRIRNCGSDVMTSKSPSRSPALPAAIFCAGMGLVLGIASFLNLYPMVRLAGRFSEHGTLSPQMAGLLRQSQMQLAWMLLFSGMLLPALLRIYHLFRRAVLGMSRRTFLLATSGVAFAWALFLHCTLLQGIPHVTDEISHLFQAKILSAGMFHAHAPPCPQSFFQHHIYITTDGKWFSIYPPGQATLFAIASFLGATAAVVPASFALATFSLGWLAHEFFRRWTARRFVLLFVACPLNALLGASYMSHVTFLAAFGAGLALFTAMVREHGGVRSQRLCGIAAGFCLAYSALIRPQEFILATAMTGIVLLIVAPRKIPLLLVRVLWLFPGAMLPVAYQLVWNQHQYGTALALGYAHSTQSVTPIMRPYYGFSADFGLKKALAISGWTLLRFNKCLLGWPSAFLLLPFALWPGRIRRRTFAAMIAAATVIAFYFFYFYYGLEYEARFYHAAVPPLLLLIVRSFDRITATIALLLRRLRTRRAYPAGRAFWVALASASWMHAALYYFPTYLWPRYEQDYELASPAIHRAAERDGLKNALVLVPRDNRGDDYSSGFMWNDPLLAAPVIYARDLGTSNECVSIAFPARAIYRFQPSDDWRDGRFDLVRAPLSAEKPGAN